MIAAQSIGEPSTQLKLDSRHSGGVASVTRHSVSTGLDRIIELFEARAPKGVGFIAEIDGEVTVHAQPDGSHQITVQGPERAGVCLSATGPAGWARLGDCR